MLATIRGVDIDDDDEDALKHAMLTIAAHPDADMLFDAEKFIQREWMKKETDFLILTQKGKLFADGIAADLFRT